MDSLKEAGLIKPPKKLVLDMYDFVCHHAKLLLIHGPEHFRENWTEDNINYLKANNRFSSSEIAEAEKFNEHYDPFFVGEKYELSDYGIEGKNTNFADFEDIVLAIEVDKHSGAAGHWNARDAEIVMNLASLFFGNIGGEEKDSKYLCNYLKSTLIHELTHAMQYIKHHDYYNRSKLRGGFPAKLKKLPYDIYKRKGDIAYLQRKYDQPEFALHTLTPVEFYPNLLQEILGFRFWHQEKGITPTNADIRKWLKESPTFKFLKELPEVYKKAVGIFVAEVKKSKEDGISYVKRARPNKLAGLVKPPFDLVKDMNDHACRMVALFILHGPRIFRSNWSRKELDKLESKFTFNRQEIRETKGEFSTLENLAISLKMIKPKGFPLTEGVYYLSEYGIDNDKVSTLYFELVFKNHDYDAAYQSHKYAPVVFLNLKSIVRDNYTAGSLCSRIKSSIIHELTHAMQHLAYPLVDNEDESYAVPKGGLPYRLKDDTPRNKRLDKNEIKRLVKKYNRQDIANAIAYITSPIEFYPHLLQEILTFRYHFQESNKEPTNADIRKFINQQSHFFILLKLDAPDLFKKAVGIFVEEVQKSKEDGVSYIKKARLMTQFTNWVKGDSDLIEEYIAKLGYHLESLVPPYLEARWNYTGNDDLTLDLGMVHFPLINIVRKRNVNLNAKAKEIQIRNKLKETFEVSDIYYDHDLKDLFGTVDYKEIRLIENLGTEIFTDEIEEPFTSFLNAFKRTVCIHYVNEVIIPYLTQFTRGGGFHVAYDPHPLPYLNLPHGHFKNFRYRGAKTLTNGVLLSFNIASTHYGSKRNEGTDFKFYFEGDSLKTEVRRDGKTLTFEGFLDDVSCLRFAYYGVNNHA